MPKDPAQIRNFAIIAHIDHGKSTLADRMIEVCGGLTSREMKEQVLDSMDIERERGITIKAQTVRLSYCARDGITYQLNLMDTPGHVDFAYEVSRSLAACEGSVLVVDATQGVEAQTLANVYQAVDQNHEVIVALNKIDLPAAEPERIKTQIEDTIGIDASGALPVSAKTGAGVEELLEAIVTRLPPPLNASGDPAGVDTIKDRCSALLVDSWYDSYLGVMILVRVFAGQLRKGQKVLFMGGQATRDIDRVGTFGPRPTVCDTLGPGEIGFITAGVKDIADTAVGDTITDEKYRADGPLSGFRPSVPVVFCSLFPADSGQYERLKDSLGKLRLNDASFLFESENSTALGHGFRCGFLGLLHLEIVQERLEREFDLDLITTAPSVRYEVLLTDGTKLDLRNPADYPDPVKIASVSEPWIQATILVPDNALGAVLGLCEERRGKQIELTWVGNRAMAVYRLPLNEIVFDFYDRLKSVSRGYASLDYKIEDYCEGDLVKLSVLVHSEPVDALAMIVHRSQAERRGRQLCERLKDLIPRQLFKIPIQAAVGGRIIARETVAAMRKDVTAKCYGGDISRKRKLLEKQKAGKKKMRQFGKVEIPQSAFVSALRMGED